MRLVPLKIASVLVVVLLVTAACPAHTPKSPGDPQYTGVNGTWSGTASRGWHQTFEFKVVDGNKIIGRQDVEHSDGRSGGGSLDGTVTGNKINVTVYKDTTATYSMPGCRSRKCLISAHGESGSTAILQKVK